MRCVPHERNLFIGYYRWAWGMSRESQDRAGENHEQEQASSSIGSTSKPKLDQWTPVGSPLKMNLENSFHTVPFLQFLISERFYMVPVCHSPNSHIFFRLILHVIPGCSTQRTGQSGLYGRLLKLQSLVNGCTAHNQLLRHFFTCLLILSLRFEFWFTGKSEEAMSDYITNVKQLVEEAAATAWWTFSATAHPKLLTEKKLNFSEWQCCPFLKLIREVMKHVSKKQEGKIYYNVR